MGSSDREIAMPMPTPHLPNFPFKFCFGYLSEI